MRIADTYNGAPVTEIGGRAFYNNRRIVSVVIPEGITTIGYNAFSSSLSKIYITNLTAWCKISGLGNMGGKKELYLNYKPITQLIIPNDVTTIGSSAFSGCSSLMSVEIPNSVTTIGSSAFYNCKSLTSVKIPNSVTTIGNDAFYGCNLTDVYMEDLTAWCKVDGLEGLIWFDTSEPGIEKVKSSSKNLYLNDRLVTQLIIPDDVAVINSYAFCGFSSIVSVEIPKGVATIGDHSFAWSSKLINVKMPDRIKTIEESAFKGCSSLASIEIPNGVTTIGESTFNGCSSLTSIEIPNSITSIVSGAFANCDKLQYKEYGNAQYLGNKDNEYVALIGVVNKNYSSYTIHENTKVIVGGAFRMCGRMTEIIIPQNVISICNEAFYLCGSLKKVYYKGTDSDWKNITIEDDNSALLNADRYYYSETQPSDTQNKYWHFVDGEIVEW